MNLARFHRWAKLPKLPLLACVALATSAIAAGIPDKPVTLVVPYAPGGMGSLFGNLVSEAISPGLKQHVIVDYRPGANGGLGAGLVAKAPADGYTLLMAVNSTMAINPVLYPKVPFDPVKDFAPVALVWTSANVLVVEASSPIHSVQELVAAARKAPGTLSFGSSGIGATPHLCGEMFNQIANVSTTHVPYKGISPALAGLLGHQVDFVFSDTSALPFIASGKLRALAVTSAQRLSVLPGTGTMAEAGLNDFVVNTWYSVVAPAGTPADAIATLNRELTRAVNDPKVRAQMKSIAVEPATDTRSAYLAQVIRSDLDKWRRFITATGIKAE
jgi:tripartite-type tricarboxylate transporter receptor subunit TctC